MTTPLTKTCRVQFEEAKAPDPNGGQFPPWGTAFSREGTSFTGHFPKGSTGYNLKDLTVSLWRRLLEKEAKSNKKSINFELKFKDLTLKEDQGTNFDLAADLEEGCEYIITINETIKTSSSSVCVLM